MPDEGPTPSADVPAEAMAEMVAPTLRIRRLPHGADLPLPAYETEGAAGLDLRSAEALTLEPGARAAAPTGIALALPPRHEGQVRPRSGLARRHGVTVLNAPGTVDEDFRGEVMVLLVNHGAEPHAIERGERIAQLVVAPVTRVGLEEAELDDTPRGEAGFGSTGR